jgi:ABC-type transport system substrate-binding protein
LAALETFSNSNPENYIRYNNTRYENLLKQLNSAASEEQKRKLCGQAMQTLLDDYRAVPLGEMFFTTLSDRRFKGWTLNRLNQLDLSDLNWDATPSK